MPVPHNPYSPALVPGGWLGAHPFLDDENITIIRPKYNSHGKKDVTGAFKPEAINFCKFHDISKKRIFIFNNHLGRYALAEWTLELIKKEKPVVFVAFCHGYTHGIQPGIRSPKHRKATETDKINWDWFTYYLSQRGAPNVVLYACSTGNDPDEDPDTAPGSGDDSLADTLRDDLCQRGAVYNRVVAHTNAGHTTHNRYLKLFEGHGSPLGGTGAALVATPGTPEWKVLGKKLKTEWRFKFPFKSVAEIHTDLVQ